MANSRLFEIKFNNMEAIMGLVDNSAKLLMANCKAAITTTTLLGIARIANDTPVKTGRSRMSIVGEYAQLASMVSAEAITLLDSPESSEGKQLSVTHIDADNLTGVIGSNVEYILNVEYGHKVTGPKKLTDKQRRFLFARGILRSESQNGKSIVIYDRGQKRTVTGSSYRVQGKAMFRKNTPIIQNYLDDQMNQALLATKDGKSMGGIQNE